MKEKPSDYVQAALPRDDGARAPAADGDEQCAELVEMIGADWLLYASDYPHDHGPSAEPLSRRSATTTAAVLRGNAAALRARDVSEPDGSRPGDDSPTSRWYEEERDTPSGWMVEPDSTRARRPDHGATHLEPAREVPVTSRTRRPRRRGRAGRVRGDRPPPAGAGSCSSSATATSAGCPRRARVLDRPDDRLVGFPGDLGLAAEMLEPAAGGRCLGPPRELWGSTDPVQVAYWRRGSRPAARR